MTVSKWERGVLVPNDYQQALMIEFEKAARAPSVQALRDALGSLLVGAGIGAVLFLLLNAANAGKELGMSKVLLIEVCGGKIQSTDTGVTEKSTVGLETRTVELKHFETKALPKLGANFIVDHNLSRRLLKCVHVDDRSGGVDGHGSIVIALRLRRDSPTPIKKSEPLYADKIISGTLGRDGRLNARSA
jgi:hypothetical protein